MPNVRKLTKCSEGTHPKRKDAQLHKMKLRRKSMTKSGCKSLGKMKFPDRPPAPNRQSSTNRSILAVLHEHFNGYCCCCCVTFKLLGHGGTYLRKLVSGPAPPIDRPHETDRSHDEDLNGSSAGSKADLGSGLMR